MFHHECTLNKPGNLLEDHTEDAPLKKTWKKWWSIDEKTPQCSKYMHSISAVLNERKRHMNSNYWWIIHPFSYFKYVWHLSMTFVYCIALFTIPLMICFVVMDYETIQLDKINLSIQLICWIDIYFNCITGYYDKKNKVVQLRPKLIIESYLRGYFILDIVSSLPYDHLTLPWRRIPGDNSNHFITIINLLPLLKLAHYRDISRHIHQFLSHLGVRNLYCEAFVISLFIVYLVFWCSCLNYLVPMLILHFQNIRGSECKDCWMVGIVKDDTFALKFQHAIFMVIAIISTNSYGIVIPKTDGHIAMVTTLLLVGRFMECCMIITFLRFMAANKVPETKYQEIMNQLKAYSNHKQLPTHMRKRLVNYYFYRFKNSFFKEAEIMRRLSDSLREEIMLKSCRKFIKNVGIFRDLPEEVLKSIVRTLKFELYLRNDVITVAGAYGDCMFFLASGKVSVFTSMGQEVGAHFGEVALLMSDHRRVTTIIAIEVSEIYRLDRIDFRRHVNKHSELFAKIEQMAAERIQNTVFLERQHHSSKGLDRHRSTFS